MLTIQSNLGSRTPRIMNNSIYEQIFRTQSVSDDVLCLESRTILGFDNEDSVVIDDIYCVSRQKHGAWKLRVKWV